MWRLCTWFARLAVARPCGSVGEGRGQITMCCSLQDVGRLACLGEDQRFGLGVAVGAGLVPDGGGAEGPGG